MSHLYLLLQIVSLYVNACYCRSYGIAYLQEVSRFGEWDFKMQRRGESYTTDAKLQPEPWKFLKNEVTFSYVLPSTIHCKPVEFFRRPFCNATVREEPRLKVGAVIKQTKQPIISQQDCWRNCLCWKTFLADVFIRLNVYYAGLE